jgi:hypothetical protein
MRTLFNVTLATAVLLLASASAPAMAGSAPVSAKTAINKIPRISQKMIEEARRSSDEFDDCMNNPDNDPDDYEGVLAVVSA